MSLYGRDPRPLRVLGYANWLSRDPISEAGGIDLYNYVANNPVNLIDPDGLDPMSAWGFGESQPQVSNDTAQQRARNRRIEVVLVKKGLTKETEHGG